jgi:hypothetical protein
MAGDFSEVTSQSWGSRLVESIKGVAIGILLFLISFPLLAWNEYRSVKTYESLKEGGSQLQDVDAAKIDKDNEGKFIATNGMATTDETVKDPDFGIAAPKVIHLDRKVEMYAWKEEKKTEKKKKLGGSEQTVTTYTYVKEWTQTPQDSSRFNEGGVQHEQEKNPKVKIHNPEMPYKSQKFTAGKVTLGAFTLPTDLVNKMDREDPFPVSAGGAKELPPEAREKGFVVKGTELYKSAGKKPKKDGDAEEKTDDSEGPAVGDLRITYSVVKPAEVSVYGEQVGDTLKPFQTKRGDALIRLEYGKKTGQEMIESAQAENVQLTWILRLVGFILMAVGIFMVFKPLVVVADVVPIFGNILSAGAFVIAIVLAIPLTLITIAIAWVAVRPLLGLGLLAVGAIVLIGGFVLFKRRRAKTA